MMLASVCLCSMWLMTITVNAAPVRFSQVVQVVDARAGRADNANFTQLRLVGDASFVADDDDDTKKNAVQQDGRVIVETRSDIVEDDACDCVQPPVGGGGFPKYALLGLAGIPLFFIIRHHKDTPTPPPDTPTPPPPTPPDTPTPPPNTPTPPPDTPTPPPNTPTPPPNTPTPPPNTPTPPPDTPTPPPNTPTPPPNTPTPPPDTPTPPPTTPTPTPTPEPVTLLLFGTGLAGIGVAARKRLRRKDDTTAGE